MHFLNQTKKIKVMTGLLLSTFCPTGIKLILFTIVHLEIVIINLKFELFKVEI